MLLPVALAASCCASGTAQPTLLGSCDALGVAFGVGGAVEVGGWSWSGAWAPAGDDGDGSASASAAILGRLAPWLQAGVRVPVALSVERLDGAADLSLGMGDALVWLDVETPAGWAPPRAPHLGLEVGLGSEGPDGADPGARVVQAVLRADLEQDAWSLWSTATGRLPLGVGGAPDGDLSLVAARALGPRVQLGLGVVGRVEPGPGYALSVGPSLLIAPTLADRVVLHLGAGLPVSGLGRSSVNRLVLSLDWLRALTAARSAA